MVVGVVGEISPRAQELVEEDCDIELVYVTIQGTSDTKQLLQAIFTKVFKLIILSRIMGENERCVK
jgi:hypothetical protein